MIYKCGGDFIGSNFPSGKFSQGAIFSGGTGIIFKGGSFHRGTYSYGGIFIGGNSLGGNFPGTLHIMQ